MTGIGDHHILDLKSDATWLGPAFEDLPLQDITVIRGGRTDNYLCNAESVGDDLLRQDEEGFQTLKDGTGQLYVDWGYSEIRTDVRPMSVRFLWRVVDEVDLAPASSYRSWHSVWLESWVSVDTGLR
jgi:hypothetical protein